MKEDWTEKLRSKLEGHRKTPPTGLWEGISEQMGLAAGSARQSTIVNRRYWRWPVAAAILALIGFFALHSDKRHRELATKEEVRLRAEKTPNLTDSPTETPILAIEQTVEAKKVKREQTNRPLVSEEEAEKVDMERDTSSATPTEEPASEEKTATRLIQEKRLAEYVPTARRPSPKWFIAINASGGLFASQQQKRLPSYTFPTDIALGSNDTNDTDETDDAIPNGTQKKAKHRYYTLTDCRYKHFVPMRFGLKLQYRLTPRIALLTGVNYTFLYSQIELLSYNTTIDQKLHYIGIPVGMSFRLWSTKHFNAYVAGSAMLEKCLNTRPWQWSATASAGAEYAFSRRVGVYLEPSVGYYFKGNTSLKNYYTEHPFAPSVEAGIRLQVGK